MESLSNEDHSSKLGCHQNARGAQPKDDVDARLQENQRDVDAELLPREERHPSLNEEGKPRSPRPAEGADLQEREENQEELTGDKDECAE